MQTTEAGRTYRAGAAIKPRRLLKLSAENTVIHATADTDKIIGVSGESTRRHDSTDHAIADEQVQVIEFDGVSTPRVQFGGTIAVGDFLVATADGKAIAATIENVSDSQTATNVNAVGPATQAGAADDYIRFRAVALNGIKVSS